MTANTCGFAGDNKRRLTALPEKHGAQPTLKPWPTDRSGFIESALLGRMRPEDQAYMARAILQMSDEIAELREIVRALQMVMRVK